MSQPSEERYILVRMVFTGLWKHKLWKIIFYDASVLMAFWLLDPTEGSCSENNIYFLL